MGAVGYENRRRPAKYGYLPSFPWYNGIRLTHDELGEVWEMIEKHAEMEKETIGLGEKALGSCRLFVRHHLLAYLVEDERKHDRLLKQLEDFKRKI